MILKVERLIKSTSSIAIHEEILGLMPQTPKLEVKKHFDVDDYSLKPHSLLDRFKVLEGQIDVLVALLNSDNLKQQITKTNQK